MFAQKTVQTLEEEKKNHRHQHCHRQHYHHKKFQGGKWHGPVCGEDLSLFPGWYPICIA